MLVNRTQMLSFVDHDLFQYNEIVAHHVVLAKRDHINSPLFSKLRMLPLIPSGRGSTFLAIVTSSTYA
jgi:hypothetical protein